MHIQPNIHIPRTKYYKIYAALISQQTTNAPTVTILENNTGRTIAWTRLGQGQYIGTITGETIDVNKTWVIVAPYNSGSSAGYYSPTEIFIGTFNIATAAYADGQLQQSALEIRIYS